MCKDVGRAREVLQAALAAAPHIRGLYEALILLEECAGLHESPEAVARVLSMLEKAVTGPPSDSAHQVSRARVGDYI